MQLKQLKNAVPLMSSLALAVCSTTGYAGLADSPNSVFKTYQIMASADDAEERASGSVTVDSKSTDLNNVDLIGLRFDQVDIPEGAVIKSAYLRFYGGNADNNGGALNVTIQGEAVDHAAPFTAADYHISDRIQANPTSQQVIWSVPLWSNSWVSQQEHKSVDITPVINEIVSRPGFVSGNAIALTVRGDSSEGRSTYLYDYTVTYPDRVRMPRLVIEYEQTAPVCEVVPQILEAGSSTYLPNYSYAGYQWGEQTLPDYTAVTPDITFVDVTSAGVMPDDGLDDTQAVLDLISAHQQTSGTVVLHFPAGRYHISDVITVNRSHFVIQGAGHDENGTVFQIDIPLSDNSVTQTQDVLNLKNDWETYGWPTTDGVTPYSLYSWIGGFFYTRYDGNRYARSTIADVVSAQRGDHTFTITNQSQSVNVGDVIRFEWANSSNNDFLDYLVGYEPVTYGSNVSGEDSSMVAQTVTVTAVNGDQVTVKEPLMHDVGRSGQTWSARIRTNYLITHVGFENFSVDFPDDTVYGGHHEEAGYNAFYLTDVQHSWVRNIAVDQADSALLIDHSKNTTVQGLKTSGRQGHYNTMIGRSYGILVQDFDLRSHALHNPSLNTDAVMTVYSDGYVDAAEIDQHNGLNHQNLVEDVLVGYTPNLWDHGGSSSRLPTAAMYNTFWNIRVQELPFHNLAGSVEDAPGARLVGIHSPGNLLSVDYTPNPYIEALNQCVTVPSLYTYQLQQRVGDIPLSAAFSADQTSGEAPLTVQFEDISSGQVVERAWDFNHDGAIDATGVSPVYRFDLPGSYTVTLTVTDADGVTDSMTQTDYITVTEAVDSTPDAFAFTDVTDAAGKTRYVSNPVTVTGINTAVSATVNGGDYRINGGSWITTDQTVYAGDVIEVAVESHRKAGRTVSVTLNVGGVTDSFDVTTASSGNDDGGGGGGDKCHPKRGC